MPEFQFDGLVGPTHNYDGLSPGNVASTSHSGQTSNPRAALTYQEAETITYRRHRRMASQTGAFATIVRVYGLPAITRRASVQRVAVIRMMDALQADVNMPPEATVVTGIEIKEVE